MFLKKREEERRCVEFLCDVGAHTFRSWEQPDHMLTLSARQPSICPPVSRRSRLCDQAHLERRNERGRLPPLSDRSELVYIASSREAIPSHF
eukprot:scaffold178_cov163-Amphora_coffeaeformis.AAC.2